LDWSRSHGACGPEAEEANDMSDEKPMCEHNETKVHRFTVTAANETNGMIATVWCRGPVIATEPETPVSEATEQMIPASLVAELLADAAQRYCPELERVEAEAYANSRWTHDARLRPSSASDPSPELRERGVTLTAEDLADLDDMVFYFSNQDTHPRWSRYRRLVTRLFNDDALKGTT